MCREVNNFKTNFLNIDLELQKSRYEIFMEHQPGDFEWWSLVVAFAVFVLGPTVKVELFDFLTENFAPSLVYAFQQA